jgi:hypothetical protein
VHGLENHSDISLAPERLEANSLGLLVVPDAYICYSKPGAKNLGMIGWLLCKQMLAVFHRWMTLELIWTKK